MGAQQVSHFVGVSIILLVESKALEGDISPLILFVIIQLCTPMDVVPSHVTVSLRGSPKKVHLSLFTVTSSQGVLESSKS